MTHHLKILLSVILWDGMVAALVFLPLFILSLFVENMLRIGNLGGGFAYQFGGAMVLYIGMIIPVVLGAIVYVIVSAVFVTTTLHRVQLRVLAVVLSPILPVTIMILQLSGYVFLTEGYSVIVASLAYGFFARLFRIPAAI